MNDLDNVKEKSFLPSRITGSNDKQNYFKFGRSAVDLLACLSGVPRPSVLITGAGDMRSIFYTLYRNFDPEFRGRFQGVDFIINENWSLLLARHILVLYLCLELPEKTEGVEGREWLAAIWAIWSCHELCPQHSEVLGGALEGLMKYSVTPKAWASPENPLGRIVKFTTPRSFQEIVKHWGQWSRGGVGNVPTVQNMRDERKKWVERCHDMSLSKFVTKEAESCIQQMLGVSASAADSRKAKMEADFGLFLQTGSVFAENTFNLPDGEEEAHTQPNITFYDGSPDSITDNPFYELVPYQAFFHTFLFSPKECRAASVARSLTERLPVKDHRFKEHPLLANSLQQLALWLSASARALQQKVAAKGTSEITFTFDCSNVICLFHELQREPETYKASLGPSPAFDAMHTSQIMDCMSAPDLILRALPLLKPGAFLFASTTFYRDFSVIADKAMDYLFGVHPEFFVAMYGMRFVGMDPSHSDTIHPRHLPWNYLKYSEKADYNKLIIIQRLLSTPLKLTHLSDMTFVAKGLMGCTHAATTAFPSNASSNCMCAETVITCMQAFTAQLDADSPIDNPFFWEPYVKLLRDQPTFEPFLYHLQTTAMLHNVHIHLVVKETDCPICKGVPLSTYVAQFSVQLPSPSHTLATILVGYAYRGKMEIMNFLHTSENYHCINALLQRIDEKGRAFLDFYFPRKFAERDYTFTIVSYAANNAGGGRVLHIPCRLFEGKLSRLILKGSRYSFMPAPPRRSAPRTSFGRTVSHVAEGEECHTVISLAPDLLDTVKTKKAPLESDQVAQREVELKCRGHKISFCFPYPVTFGKMKIEIRYKEKTATVVSPRSKQSFYDEAPLWVSSPTNRLFLPARSFTPTIRGKYLNMQFTMPEHAALQVRRQRVCPIIRMKEIVSLMFQQVSGARFMHIYVKEISLSIRAAVVIHDELLDPETKSPAIDLSYCFFQGLDPMMNTPWRKMTAGHKVNNMCIHDVDYANLKNLFTYFARRTHAVFSSNSRTTLGMIPTLGKHKLDHCFTRALLYPLYCDPDLEGSGVYSDPCLKGPDGLYSPKKLLTSADMDHMLQKLGPQLVTQSVAALLGVPRNTSPAVLRQMEIAAGMKPIIGTGEEEKEKEKGREGETEGTKVEEKGKEGENKEDEGTDLKSKNEESESNRRSSTMMDAKETSDSVFATMAPINAAGSKGRCAHCGKSCGQMKKCAACGKVRYCSRECQKKHWKHHKPNCTTTSAEKSSQNRKRNDEGGSDKKRNSSAREEAVTIRPNLMKCSFCQSENASLKRCKCYCAAYCNNLCQRQDWPRHKRTCSAAPKHTN